jgi:hypothetical protein
LIERTISNYTRTYTGRKFWPLNPRHEDVCIEDIAGHLSKICRFGGATRTHYSVAQHSVLASNIVSPRNRLAALLHDASEAYIGDVCRPIKPHFQGYADLEDRLMRIIADVFGFEYPFDAEIKVADMRLLVTERRDLMPDRECPHTETAYRPLDEIIEPWAHETARFHFLQRYQEVTRK